jgi:hypothetical protein
LGVTLLHKAMLTGSKTKYWECSHVKASVLTDTNDSIDAGF